MSNPSNGSAPTTPHKEKRATDLDLSNASRGVWLVKVPKYIADRWENADDNTLVGSLRIAKSQTRTAVSFSLSDEIVKAKPGNQEGPQNNKIKSMEIPKEHKFVIGNLANQTMAVLSHTAGDREALVPTQDKLSLEGKVVQRAECRPISNNIYMQLKKESIISAIEPTRKTKQLDKAVVAFKPKSNHQANIAFEAKKKAEGKKSREDKEKVMEILFSLFEKHQYYNIKDLVKATRQPVTYLKEILKEVCNYNLKNPHKNMWELKPEYRHYKEDKKQEEEAKEESSSDDD